jgi:hypothetical protein
MSNSDLTPLDPRGPQFNATLTSIVLALALLTATTPFGIAVLALQAGLFATALLLGVQRTPAAYLFKRFVRPRLGPPTRLEDPRPPQFAQGIGLLFTATALVGFLAGPTWLGYAAAGMALVAAVLNASVQVCLGCQIYGVCHLPQDTYSSHRTPTKKEALV